MDLAATRGDADYELIDLRDHPLPHLDEPLPPSFGQYQNDHTHAWAKKVASFDGFVIITPEYNHSAPGVLKNALDYLFAEWNNNVPTFNTMLDQVISWSNALAPLRTDESVSA